jgi:signal transduction histidine kinase
MDVSLAKAGRSLQLELAEVDLAAVARDVVNRLRLDAARAGCSIVLTAKVPVIGKWDRFRLDQVVTNLLANAIKFGASKPIEVTVEPAGSAGRLRVKDHGIGVTPEDTNRIFQRFERAVSARAYGGLGLGLYIVSQIVEAHEGIIRLESQPGAGSTFTVELPREPPRSTRSKQPFGGGYQDGEPRIDVHVGH